MPTLPPAPLFIPAVLARVEEGKILKLLLPVPEYSRATMLCMYPPSKPTTPPLLGQSAQFHLT